MPDSIKSGYSGNLAIVDEEGRMYVKSTSISEAAAEALIGKCFIINTGIIALTTTGSYSGLLYIKNLASSDLFIHLIELNGTQMAQWQTIKTPTTGTLISGGTAIVGYNANIASGVSLNATLLKGADALTVTDGTAILDNITSIGTTPNSFRDTLIIPVNKTIAWTVKPSAAGNFSIVAIVYYD